MPAAKKTAKPKAAAKAKTAKAKTKLAKPKVVAKAKKPTAAAKAAPKNVKSLAEKRKTAPAGKPMKPQPKGHAPAGPSMGTSIFWKLLEARRQKKEQRSNENHGSHGQSERESRDKFHNQKHANFGRFAGPRRKAA